MMTGLPEDLKVTPILIDENKWIEFSQIQFAEYLVQDEHSIAVFNEWLKTGNPDDAWE